MFRTSTVAVVVLLALAAPLAGHNPNMGEYTCPVCQGRHVDEYHGPRPAYISSEALTGIGPELLGWPNMDMGHYYWIRGCPDCGYCNTQSGFHVVTHDTIKAARHPFDKVRTGGGSGFFEDVDDAEDDPTGEQDKGQQEDDERDIGWREYTQFIPARPLDFPAIGRSVRQATDGKRFRYIGPDIAERVDILLRVVPDISPADRMAFAINAAWACDAGGDTEIATAFRPRAVREGQALVADLPPSMALWHGLAVRYQLVSIQLRMGQVRGGAHHQQGRRAMVHLGRSLPRLAGLARARAKELHGQIAILRKQVPARLAKRYPGADADSFSEPDEWREIFREEHWDQPGLKELYDRILLLRLGEKKKDEPAPRVGAPAPVPAAPPLKELCLADLESQLRLVDELQTRIEKELAVDTMRSVPLDKALARARQGGAAQAEIFLAAHGHWRGRPKVREFLRELLVPLYKVWREAEDRPDGYFDDEPQYGAGYLFDDDPFSRTPRHVPQPRPKEAVQFRRHIEALAWRRGVQSVDWLAKVVVAEVLPDHCRQFLFEYRKPDRNVLLRPANAGAVAKALAGLDDVDEPARPVHTLCFPDSSRVPLYFDELTSDEHGPWGLARLDAAWSAELLLNDLLRRPRVHMLVRFDNWFGDLSEVSPEGKVYPARLIARHVSGKARQAAKDALDQLAGGKGSALSAAAAMLPLAYMDGAPSLALLRRAVKSPHAPVRLLAARCLLDRSQREGMATMVAESLRVGRPALLIGSRLHRGGPELIGLLKKEDLPTLRALWQKVVQSQAKALAAYRARKKAPGKPERPEGGFFDGEGAPRKPEIRRNDYWVLAGMAHLGDADARKQYNRWLFRITAKIGQTDPEFGWHVPHTPLTARCANAYRALRDGAAIHCTEAAARELLKHTRLLPHWRWDTDVLLLNALAGNPKVHEFYRQVARNLAQRPTRLPAKYAMLRHAKAIPTPEVNAAIERWSRSDHPELARKARKALAGMAADKEKPKS